MYRGNNMMWDAVKINHERYNQDRNIAAGRKKTDSIMNAKAKKHMEHDREAVDSGTTYVLNQY